MNYVKNVAYLLLLKARLIQYLSWLMVHTNSRVDNKSILNT
jgi:hypothetical protein